MMNYILHAMSSGLIYVMTKYHIVAVIMYSRGHSQYLNTLATQTLCSNSRFVSTNLLVGIGDS